MWGINYSCARIVHIFWKVFSINAALFRKTWKWLNMLTVVHQIYPPVHLCVGRSESEMGWDKGVYLKMRKTKPQISMQARDQRAKARCSLLIQNSGNTVNYKWRRKVIHSFRWTYTGQSVISCCESTANIQIESRDPDRKDRKLVH